MDSDQHRIHPPKFRCTVKKIQGKLQNLSILNCLSNWNSQNKFAEKSCFKKSCLSNSMHFIRICECLHNTKNTTVITRTKTNESFNQNYVMLPKNRVWTQIECEHKRIIAVNFVWIMKISKYTSKYFHKHKSKIENRLVS